MATSPRDVRFTPESGHGRRYFFGVDRAVCSSIASALPHISSSTLRGHIDLIFLHITSGLGNGYHPSGVARVWIARTSTPHPVFTLKEFSRGPTIEGPRQWRER